MDDENVVTTDEPVEEPIEEPTEPIVEEPTEETILTTVKRLLGVTEEYVAFDPQLIVCINASFGVLHQAGYKKFHIDETTVWSEYTADANALGMIQQYVYKKTKTMFDPAQNGAVRDAEQHILDEMLWRLNCAVDPEDTFDWGDEDEEEVTTDG